MSSSDAQSLAEGLVASGALIFMIVIIGIVCLIGLAAYILQAIALYKMATKLGHQYPWMAWIPYANTYLLFTLPDKKLKILAFNKEIERATGFWIWLAISLGGGVIQGILSALTVIPVIGLIIAVIVYLLPIAILVARIFITYSAYKDLYDMFVDESQATPFAIVSIIVPITSVVFLLIAAGKNPKPVVQVEENNGQYTYY